MGNQDTVLEIEERKARLREIFWIADAPLFIDERLVGRFFDAVVRPKYEHLSTESSSAEQNENGLAGELGIGGTAGLNLPAFLKPLKAEVTAEGALSIDRKRQESSSSTMYFKNIWTAERQLEELSRHYLVHHRTRIVTSKGAVEEGTSTLGKSWYEFGAEYYVDVPRAIAFLDLSPGTMLIPTAAEFSDGSVVRLYEELVRMLTGEEGGPMQSYPEDAEENSGDLLQKRREYWISFAEYFDSRKAMVVIEDASSKHGRINWIDFRLPLDGKGNTLHLHVVPAGTADAGTFGYNFVRRAYRHGVRIVGTLRARAERVE